MPAFFISTKKMEQLNNFSQTNLPDFQTTGGLFHDLKQS